MSKFRLCITMIALTSLVAPIAYGQMFSSKPPATNASGGTAPAPLPPPLTPMSPGDFKKQVNSMNQQTQNSLNQQVLQKLTKQPPSPAVPPASQIQSTAPATTAPTEEKTTSEIPPPTEEVSGAAAPSSESENEESAAPITPSTGSKAPGAAPPAQNQPYTGFQSGGGNSGSNAGSQSGGGWNIKY